MNFDGKIRMRDIILDKSIYSQWVIRNSLYWMSIYSNWLLEETDEQWKITFKNNDESVLFEFNKLLNDYILREIIELKTGKFRESVINKVLASMNERLIT
ncbi:TPA: His-Xaa-Ser system protein HxsD [Proteus mirabilis]|nr:His-Xaa-Ser system protein HxsD [Proteus mirabilis]MBI6532916.1 His-Xaa-Ser system protein HxsD [Proteus mirabilis]MBS5892108.1 His-Xaa-Ser system protein HxsD [Proteus mirabilis]HCU0230291.1 His-Xaa-Ser system protein HxsD [Proteus mirabilis]HEJ9563626.1 His-Xaa-Ser system protein HxsD [Proteus mirabilis]